MATSLQSMSVHETQGSSHSKTSVGFSVRIEITFKRAHKVKGGNN